MASSRDVVVTGVSTGSYVGLAERIRKARERRAL
jgi:hypothetical protein